MGGAFGRIRGNAEQVERAAETVERVAEEVVGVARDVAEIAAAVDTVNPIAALHGLEDLVRDGQALAISFRDGGKPPPEKK